MNTADRRGLTLVELLIVVAFMGIIAAMALPNFDPGVVDQLESAAYVTVGDADYARSLAVGNNSTYEIVFDFSKNRYYIRHTGANAALHDLPPSPYLVEESEGAGRTRQVADFAKMLPHGPTVTLHAVRRLPGNTSVGSVEFQPLGHTTQSNETIVWLVCGEGRLQRFVPVTISHITGLSSVGDVQTTAP
jgi:prepilin-type N-terminal cleavage/methylation domain-containing protein